MVRLLKIQQIELTDRKFKTAAQQITDILRDILKSYKADDKAN